MKPETREQSIQRFAKAIPHLYAIGYEAIGTWKFRRDGKTYDFSSANIELLVEDDYKCKLFLAEQD